MKIFTKLKSAFHRYNVEPIVFFYMIGYNLSLVCYLKLIQDKVCQAEFNFDDDFCANIHQLNYVTTGQAVRVLTRTTSLSLISSISTAFPSLLSVLFIGPWLDKFRFAPKLVLCITTLFGIFESILFLLNTYFLKSSPWWLVFAKMPNSFTGSLMLTYTCVFTYAIKETRASSRTVRLNWLEAAIIFPSPIAYMSSSFLSETIPWIIPEQTLNYMAVFFFSLCSYSIAFLYSISFLKPVNVIDDMNTMNESKRLSIWNTIPTFGNELLKDSNVCFRSNSISSSLNEVKVNSFESSSASVTSVESYDSNQLAVNDSTLAHLNAINAVALADNQSNNSQLIKEQPKETWTEMFRELFKLDNVKKIYYVSIKKRENKGRTRLWVVYAMYTVIIIVTQGCSIIMVSFVQHTYGWTTSQYQYVDGFGKLILGFVSTTVLHLLSKVGKVSDTKIIMVGIFCAFFMNSFRAVFPDPRGLYFSYVFGSVLLAGLVGCRAVVSKLIPVDEQASVMSAMSAIYALSPMIGNLIYSKTFEISLKSMDGLPFATGSVICVVAMLLLVWLDYSMQSLTNNRPTQTNNSS